ncbi:MAG TPA: ISAs1 family transposase [Rhizomicrobium sp.]|nr:ISAs1 family transposase [Rhizomicrobium sp.]
MDAFQECFGDLDDPRADNARHDLVEIVFIALLATLCGATSCGEMEEFGLAKQALLRTILTLEHGVPSHDTFSRVFRLLDPRAFEAAFSRFMQAFGASAKLGKTKGVVAVDGKSLRRAYEAGQSHMPRMMVSLWAAQTRMTLASVLAPNNDETQAALDAIAMVALKGCIVTADALHCHAGMAKAITDKGGDYVLAVKANQPSLLADAKLALAKLPEQTVPATTQDAAHGRAEPRAALVTSAKAMARKHRFPGLAAVAKITSRRGADEPVERFFLLSQPYKAQLLLAIRRDHWGIENALHWTLDVVMGEDLARNRKDNGPANLAILRRLALNIARAHPDKKTSLRRKLLRAGWDEAFLFDLIRHMR